MNLHILEDNKFYHEIISEILGRDLVKQNKFAVKLLKNKTELFHIGLHTKAYPNIEIIDKNYSLTELAKGYDKVFFHALRKEDVRELSSYKKPDNQAIYWRQWTSDSSDIEQIARIRNFDIEHPRLKNLDNVGIVKKLLFYDYNLIIKLALWAREQIRYPRIHRALSKIDFVGNWNQFETERLKKLYKNFTPRFVFLQYTKDSIVQPIVEKEKNSDETNILLGHSGFPDNYHKEVIGFLGTLKEKQNLNVYVPLSYGYDKYIAEVVEYGKTQLGEGFKPLLSFMKKDEYFNLLASIDVCIFNNDKPSAAANIFSLLAMGKKVFLQKQNPMYTEFAKKGISLFTVDELMKNPKLLHQKLTKEEKIANNSYFTGASALEEYEKSMEIFIS
ncbi:MAG: TDP-N-acetylfucosamine:lipid II N-acetylfucosaminyltransferase [Salinivirgaceae bacterium]|jgi:hypothetical protein|nr:TDP-N-acetylfucosamine:lipid II N-acetylfucosaminyltransferase [Salinivirgaceae bacterium]